MHATPQTIQSRLRLFAFLLVALPLAIALVLFVFFIRERMTATALHEIDASLDHQRLLIENWMAERMKDASTLAGLYRGLGGPDRSAEELREFLAHHPDVSAIVVAGPDGRTVYDTAWETGADVSRTGYFLAAREGRATAGSVMGKGSSERMVVFAAPIKDTSGVFNGVLYLPVTLDSIREVLFRPEALPGERFTLLDGDGTVLLDSADRNADGPPPFDESLFASVSAVPQGVPFRTREQGRAMLGLWKEAKGGEWLLTGQVPLQQVYEELYVFLGVGLAACVLTILLLTPLLFGFIRSLVRPVEWLAGAARSIERSGYALPEADTVFAKAPREIVDLRDAFERMARRVRADMEALAAISNTDELTGLANKRFLMAEGERLARIALRAGQPCACLMIDLDRFKQINDTHGHKAGDEALAAVGLRIAACCRASDLVARFGGEEFSVVAPGADAHHALILATRIRQAVSGEPVATRSGEISCTVSLGVAEVRDERPDGAAPLEDAMSRADMALYGAKRDGRNRVRVDGADEA